MSWRSVVQPSRPTLSAAAIGMAGLMLMGSLAGCTQEPKIVGRMGVTSDGYGHVVLVLAPCGGSIDTIQLALLPYGKQTKSGQVGSWKSASVVSTTTWLALSQKNPGWAGPSISTESTKHYIASALSTTHKNDAFPDVTFSGGQVASMTPTDVYVNSENADSSALVAHPGASFQDWACNN